ncbi:MAG: ROK family protein [Phycisphaeraceae bacterium]
MAVLACDLGGTRIKLGVVEAGRVLARRILDAESAHGLGPRLSAVEAALRELCDEAGVARVAGVAGAGMAGVAGVGISIPGIIDPHAGRVLAINAKYDDATQLDLGAWARQCFNLPLAMDNDARMALIGEWRHGAGRGCDNIAMITLGTGIGVAAVVEGRVLRGAHGQATILGGHLTVDYAGRRCTCGNIGCAEAEASTDVLAALAQTRDDLATSALAGETILDYRAVFDWAKRGDTCAAALRDHSLNVWAALAVNLVHAFDPERIVVGGGIAASDDLLPAMQRYVDQYAWTPRHRVELVRGRLGDDAALVACEWLVEKNHRGTETQSSG